VALVFLSIVTQPFFEYGSIAFLYAVFGRMVVEKQQKHFLALTVTSYLTFVFWQLYWFRFDWLPALYVIIGSAWVVAWLARCPNNVIWPNWRESYGKTFIAILSRNTLPYYFYHRLIFELLSAVLLGRSIMFSLRFF